MHKFIDIHGHAMNRPGLPFCTCDEPMINPETLLQYHKEAGFSHGVLLPIIGPENTSSIQSNEEILEVAAKSNGHFIPFCNLDPRMIYNSPEAKLQGVMEYYKSKGCKGIGEMTCNLHFTDPRCMNFFRCAEQAGLSITFHIATREGRTYGVIDELGLPGLEQVMKSFPKLKFLAHSQSFWSHISADVNAENWGGYPKGKVVSTGRVTELMRRYPNLLGDLSAGSGCNALARDPEHASVFLEEFQDRLFFGTDVCLPSQKSTLIMLRDFLENMLAQNAISQEVFDKVTHLNAEKLLDLE